MTKRMNNVKSFLVGGLMLMTTFCMTNACFASTPTDVGTAMRTEIQDGQEVTSIAGKTLDVELDLRKIKSASSANGKNIKLVYVSVDMEKEEAQALVYYGGDESGFIEFRDYYGNIEDARNAMKKIDGKIWKLFRYDEDKTTGEHAVMMYKDVGESLPKK